MKREVREIQHSVKDEVVDLGLPNADVIEIDDVFADTVSLLSETEE